MRVAAVCLLFVASLLSSCADVPEEAVTLSVTVGNDLEEVHRSHRALAERYFARMKSDIDAFVDEKYAPFITDRTLKAEVKLPNGQKTTILDIIVAEAKKEGAGRTLAFMGSTVKKITAQIARYRNELMAPVEAQEREVLRAVDDTYAKIQNAHAVVTGHLASVRRVQQAQQELLETAGLKDLRRKFIDTTASVSDRVAEITVKARRGEQSIESAAKSLCEFLNSVSGILKKDAREQEEAVAACKKRVESAGSS